LIKVDIPLLLFFYFTFFLFSITDAGLESNADRCQTKYVSDQYNLTHLIMGLLSLPWGTAE